MLNNKPLQSREAQIIDANHAQSTHNRVISNAAFTLLFELIQKYFPAKVTSASSIASSSASSLSSQVLTISTEGDAAAGEHIKKEIKRYLERKGSKLKENTKTWLNTQLKADAPLDNLLDKVTLTYKLGTQVINTEWYLPLREVFVAVFKALIDRSEAVWPVPEDSTAVIERLHRLREFDKINNALANSKPALCTTGVRHSWLQALDGYQGKHLPLNEEDVLFQGLRDFVTQVLHKQWGAFPNDKDPEGEARTIFGQSFKTLYLPWLLNDRMPSAVLDGIKQAGGSDAIEKAILDDFERIGVVPGAKMFQKIQNYSQKESLKETPCDFTPFLATLRSWLKNHATWLLLNPKAEGKSAKDKLVKQIVTWLSSKHFNLAPVTSAASSSSAMPIQELDGMQAFYRLNRLFDAMDQFQKNKILLTVADIPSDKIAAWLMACEYLQERLLETVPSLERILQQDTNLEEHLKVFEAGYTAWRQNSYSDFITNFFVDWFAADDDANIAARSKLFTTLADIYFREQPSSGATKPVIHLSDELINEWREKASEEDLLKLDVYQVNRFLLHALSYPPSTWTSLFREYTGILLTFIRANFNEPEASLKVNLARDSYPQELLSQIDGLIAQLDALHQTQQALTNSPPMLPTVLTPSLLSPAVTIRATYYLLLAPEVSEQLIRQIISSQGFDAKTSDELNLTPMYLAAERGNNTITATLIKAGADVNAKFKNLYSPLYIAEARGHHDIVRLLLDSGKIEPIATHFNEKTALFVAISNDYLDLAKRLLELIPEEQRLDVIKILDQDGKTILHWAFDKPTVLRTILEYIAEGQRLDVIKIPDQDGKTVLHWASDKPIALRTILKYIPESQRIDAARLPDKDNKPVLQWAAKNRESLIITLESIPADQRLDALKTKTANGLGGYETVLHMVGRYAVVPLVAVLDLIPQDQRFDAVAMKCEFGQVVLHSAGDNILGYLKPLLESIPEGLRADVVRLKNQEGNTIMHLVKFNPVLLNAILELIPEAQRYEAVRMPNKHGFTALYYMRIHFPSLSVIFKRIPQHDRHSFFSGEGALSSVPTGEDESFELRGNPQYRRLA